MLLPECELGLVQARRSTVPLLEARRVRRLPLLCMFLPWVFASHLSLCPSTPWRVGSAWRCALSTPKGGVQQRRPHCETFYSEKPPSRPPSAAAVCSASGSLACA